MKPTSQPNPSSRRSGLLIVILTLWSAWPSGVSARNLVWERYPNETKTNLITAELKVEGETPEWMAIVVQGGATAADSDEAFEAALETYHAQIRTNRNARPPFAQKTASVKDAFQQAKWIPFQTNVLIDLGPGDGERTVYFSYKYKGQSRPAGWSGAGVTVRTAPLQITIVNPEQLVTPYRIIQLQGRSNHELQTIRYTQRDATGKVLSEGEGFANATFTGDTKFKTLSKCFICFDIELSLGTNIVELDFEDVLGNTAKTNVVIVFSTATDHEPPLLELQWPAPGMTLAGKHFVARGKGNDPGATITGWIIANGKTNQIAGFPERNGYFWYEDIPLATGANQLTLILTDPAGNVSQTNLVIYGSDGPVISMDDIVPAAKLWDAYITVTGKVTPAVNDVWINGVKARVSPDGTWEAHRVPVRSPNGGTAVFTMTTASPETIKQAQPEIKEVVTAQTSLGTNALTLNASTPACGVFQLRLTGTAGRKFVLLSSTNLTDWQSILTNHNPQAKFEYTDFNANKLPCRFFRVVPLAE